MKKNRMSKEERKKQICDAARSLFIEKGFENTTMKDIMLASNISVGGLYHHYNNTYDILIDTVVDVQEFKENIFFVIKEKRPNIDSEEAMAEALVNLLFDKSEYSILYVMLLVASKENEKLRMVHEDIELKNKEKYLDYLKSLQMNEFKCFVNDDLLEFLYITKVGNYYLKYEGDTENTRKLYLNFIKYYIKMHRSSKTDR